ncbi:unnamed protein product [Moneuplotes crassus]|uniref:Uncharacterized protein n=1 Tax=Euplotes crassus TaxID=5936 RepID=A0AAD2D6C1_EUPCR|nr:unnamed protein product [Moneuplotes crassus]
MKPTSKQINHQFLPANASSHFPELNRSTEPKRYFVQHKRRMLSTNRIRKTNKYVNSFYNDHKSKKGSELLTNIKMLKAGLKKHKFNLNVPNSKLNITEANMGEYHSHFPKNLRESLRKPSIGLNITSPHEISKASLHLPNTTRKKSMITTGMQKLKEMSSQMDTGVNQMSQFRRKSVRTRRKRRIIRVQSEIQPADKSQHSGEIRSIPLERRTESKMKKSKIKRFKNNESMKSRLRKSPFKIIKRRLYSAKSRRSRSLKRKQKYFTLASTKYKCYKDSLSRNNSVASLKSAMAHSQYSQKVLNSKSHKKHETEKHGAEKSTINFVENSDPEMVQILDILNKHSVGPKLIKAMNKYLKAKKILHSEEERIEFIHQIAEAQMDQLINMQRSSAYELKFATEHNFSDEICLALSKIHDFNQLQNSQEYINQREAISKKENKFYSLAQKALKIFETPKPKDKVTFLDQYPLSLDFSRIQSKAFDQIRQESEDSPHTNVSKVKSLKKTFRRKSLANKVGSPTVTCNINISNTHKTMEINGVLCMIQMNFLNGKINVTASTTIGDDSQCVYKISHKPFHSNFTNNDISTEMERLYFDICKGKIVLSAYDNEEFKSQQEVANKFSIYVIKLKGMLTVENNIKKNKYCRISVEDMGDRYIFTLLPERKISQSVEINSMQSGFATGKSSSYSSIALKIIDNLKQCSIEKLKILEYCSEDSLENVNMKTFLENNLVATDYSKSEDLLKTAQLGIVPKDMNLLKKLNDSDRNNGLLKLFSTENTQNEYNNFEIMIREEAITKHQKVIEKEIDRINEIHGKKSIPEMIPEEIEVDLSECPQKFLRLENFKTLNQSLIQNLSIPNKEDTKEGYMYTSRIIQQDYKSRTKTLP